MTIKNWKKELFTIPNILSMFRLILIPVYVTIYLNAQDSTDYLIAGGILAVSCLTDMLDGQIARRFNMISNIGKLLDPIADKLTQFAMIICLGLRYPTVWLLIGLFVVKEVFQLVSTLVALRKRKMLDGAILPGKISTTVLFTSLVLMVVIPELSDGAVLGFVIVNAIMLTYSFIAYICAFWSKASLLKDVEFEDEQK